MCITSQVGNYFTETFPNKYPDIVHNVSLPFNSIPTTDYEARRQILELRQEMEELKKLLKAAKEFDEKTGQPSCESEPKVKLIKDIAKLVGVDLEDIL